MTNRIWRVAGVLALALCFVTPLVSWAATEYTYSNVDNDTLAVASDGKYGTTSIQFVLSNPSTNHAVGDFPSSGYVSLTKISISARSDNNYQAVTKATLTNNKTSTSYTATVSYSAGNDFVAYKPTAWERKEVLLSFDGEVLLDTTATYTLAFLNDSNASTTLGYSVVRKGSSDWRPAMRISGQELGFKNVERTIAADADTTWDAEAWTVDGTANQSFVPDSDTIYSVTVTVGGDCTVTMPESIGSFKACDVNFVLDGSAEAANVTLKYSGTFPSDSATTANFSPFGSANVTASEGITFNSVYEGDTEGYVTKADGVNYYVAKRPNVGVVSVRIGARTTEASGGNILNTPYSNVGPYPVSGLLWNQTKLWNNNSIAGTYTDIQNLADAKDGSSAVRIAYYGHNTYFNSNAATLPNMVLTKTYLDDSDSGNGDLTATHDTENITLPTPGHNRGWQLHFENIPYNAYDVYFITASDVENGNLKETPIYVSLDGGSTWKSYCGDSTNQKTVMGTDPWTGLPYAQNGVLVHGKNYIKMRITKSIYGDNIGTIDITHGVRNTGSSIRSGLAAIQIVEVQNDGVYSLQENGNWSGAIWTVGSLTDQTWTDTVEGEASIAKIASSETVSSVTVDQTVSAGSVILTGSDPFTVAGSSTLTVGTGFDASAFTGALNLQAPISGTIYIGANTDLEFGGDTDMTLPAYTLDGAGAWQKVGAGKLTVNSPLTLAGTVNAGSVEFTSSTSGNLSLLGGNLVLAGGQTELIYSGSASLADQGSGKTVVSSGVVQSTGSIATDIDVENGATLKLGAIGGFGSTNNGQYASGKTITIKEGGTIELNGIEGCNAYTLAGGTLQNTGSNIGNAQRQTNALTLTDDSTVNAGSNFGLLNSGYGDTTLTLDGHKLRKTGEGTFLLCHTTTDDVEGGEIDVNAGTLLFTQAASVINVPVVVASGASLQMDVASSVAAVSGAGNVTGSSILTTSAIDLSEGLTVASPVTLADGATITQGAGTISGSIAVAGTATVSGASENQLDGIRLITVGATLTVNDGANVSAPAVGVDGYILTMDTSDPGKTVYALALAKAKTGDTYYATVDDAFTALNEATDTSTILRVLDDDFDVATFSPSALAGGDPETVGIFWDETARTYAYAAATVNGAYFQTLTEALTAAKTAGGKTATLFKNNADTTIVIPAEVKLVLGDYTITATPTTEVGYVIGITADDTVYTSITNDESEWKGEDNGKWSDYFNWSTGAVPGANTAVTLPDGTYTIGIREWGSSAHQCRSMTVDGTVTFVYSEASDFYPEVTVYGDISGSGKIVLKRAGLWNRSDDAITIACDLGVEYNDYSTNDSFLRGNNFNITGNIEVNGYLKIEEGTTVNATGRTALDNESKIRASNNATMEIAELVVTEGASATLNMEASGTVTHTGTVTVPAGAQLTVTGAGADYVMKELTGAGAVTLNNGTIALLDGYTGTLGGALSITTVNVDGEITTTDPVVRLAEGCTVKNISAIKVTQNGAETAYGLYKQDNGLYVKMAVTLFRAAQTGAWFANGSWTNETGAAVWDNDKLILATINADEVDSISIDDGETAKAEKLTIIGDADSELELMVNGTGMVEIDDALDLSGMTGTIVKSGTGTFTAKGDNSGATLNWTVNAGMLSLGGGFDSIGGDGTVVTINGGIVDIAGAYGGNTAKTLVIEGEGLAFTSSASVASPGNQCYPFTNIVVNANSTFGGDESWGVIARGYAKSYISIKEGVTFTKTGSGTFHLNNTTISGDGTLSVKEGSINAGAANCTVDNLQLKEAANIAVGSSALTVNNSFKIANGEDAVLLTDFTTDKVVLGNDAKVELVKAGTLNVGTWRGNNELVLPAGSTLQIQLASWSELEIELNVTGITADNVELLPVEGYDVPGSAEVTLEDRKLTIKRSVNCMVINPITGERVAVDYKFVGEGTDWEMVANWNRQSGTYNIWNALDGDKVPALTESGMFKPILVDGKTAILANESTATTMEGYNLKLAALNGAVVEVGALVKIQGDNWIMADGESTVTFNAWKDAASSAKLEGTLKYYLADNSKVRFNMPFVNSTTSSLMVEYYLEGNALVDYAASVSNGTHVIKQATIEIGTGAYKVIKTKPLVKYSESSVTFDTSDIRITSKSGTPVPHTGELSGFEEVGTYVITEDVIDEVKAIYIEYIGLTNDEPVEYEYVINVPEDTDWDSVTNSWGKAPGPNDTLIIKVKSNATFNLGEEDITVRQVVVMMDEEATASSATLTLSGAKLTAGYVFLYDPVTVVAGAADQLVGTLQGNGTVTYTTVPSDATFTNNGWAGVLWLQNCSCNGTDVSGLASENSVLRLTGVSAYFAAAKTCKGALELQDDGDTPALTLTDGWSTYNPTVFGKLLGTGTLTASKNTVSQRYVFKDASEFNGSIDMSGKIFRIILGDGETLNPSDGTITIAEGANVTVASGKTWSANSSIVNNGTATVNGTLSGTVTNTGTMIVNGTVSNAVTNAGTMTVDGTVSGAVINNGTMKLYGTSSGGLTNNGTLWINKDFDASWENNGNLVLMANNLNVQKVRDFSSVEINGEGITQVTITQTAEEFGKGDTRFTNAGAFESVTIKLADGTDDTITPDEDGAGSSGGSIHVSGKAAWCEYEMDYESGNEEKTGFQNTGMDTTGLNSDSGITGDNAFTHDGENGLLYTYAHPWRNIQYPKSGTWTAMVRCTVPKYEEAAVITFGTNSGGLIGLIAGENPEHQMRLVQTTGNSHYITNATMTVQQATTKQHVYLFAVETNQTVTVYCDGRRVIQKTFESAFTIGNGLQVGSVHGGTGATGLVRFAKDETPASTLPVEDQKRAQIDCVRIYDYSLNSAQMEALWKEYEEAGNKVTSSRTLEGDGTKQWYEAEYNTWYTIGEGTDEDNGYMPPDGADVTLTVDGEQALTVELNAYTYDADNNIQNLIIEGTGADSKLTIRQSLGGHAVNVIGGSVSNDVALTIQYGAINIDTAPIILGENGSITFEITKLLTGLTTDDKVWLTGYCETKFADGKIDCVYDTTATIPMVNYLGTRFDEADRKYYIAVECKRQHGTVYMDLPDGDVTVEMLNDVRYVDPETGNEIDSLLIAGDELNFRCAEGAHPMITINGSLDVTKYVIPAGVTVDFGTAGSGRIPIWGQGTAIMTQTHPLVTTDAVADALTNSTKWAGTLIIKNEENFNATMLRKFGNANSNLILSRCKVLPESGYTVEVPVTLDNDGEHGWGLNVGGRSDATYGQVITIETLKGTGLLMSKEDGVVEGKLTYLKVKNLDNFEGAITCVVNDGYGMAITIGDEAEPRADGATISLKVTENALLPVYREISSTKGILVDGTMAVHTEGVTIDGESLAFGANGVLEISEQGAYPVIVAAASGTIKVTLADGVTASEGMTLLKVLEAEELPTVTCGNATGYEVVSETSSGYKVYRLKRSGFYIRIR